MDDGKSDGQTKFLFFLGPSQFECGCNEGWDLINSNTCVEL